MKFNLKDIFKNPFKKEKTSVVTNNTDKAKEAFAKIITQRKNEQKPKKFKPKETCEIQGHTFKIGDKVICRSNEPYPLMVGKIIEFWDNQGKWSQPIPVVRNNRTGKKFNVHGIVRPYTQELMDALRPLKPLEQWNHFVPEDAKYTEEQMKHKEETFEKREKFLPKKK